MKKIRIHKNRIFLSLIIMTIIMLIVSFFCVVFLNNTVLAAIRRDSKNFDSAADKISDLFEKDIEYKINLLNVYSELFNEIEQTNSEDISALFSKIQESFKENGFKAFAVIFDDTSFISSHDNVIKAGDATKIKSAFTNLPDRNFYLEAGFDDFSYYCVPILLKENKSGILVGITSSDFSTAEDKNSSAMEQAVSYLLNEDNEVVLYHGGEGKDFSYAAIDKDSFYVDGRNYVENASLFFDSVDNSGAVLTAKVAGTKTNDILHIVSNFYDLEIVAENGNYIWYETPVLVDGVKWNLVVGKMASLSGESLSLIISNSILVAFVIVISFIIMILLVISQGVSNRKLMKLAYTDFVTDSGNWLRFQLEAEKLLRRKSKSASYMIVSMDIRKFRVISEIEGEVKSDLLLKNIAGILKRQLVSKEWFSRFSVDEFALLIKCRNEQEATDRIMALDIVLKSQLPIQGISFCYGIYPVCDNMIPVQKMYNYAGIARDIAKGRTDSPIVLFDAALHDNMLREKELESSMEEALANEEFHVYLQPKYSADGERVGGAEALVRWISPKFGFISPGDFIPLFEKNGFILKLDSYMLNHVCAALKKWIQQGNSPVTISVNISRVHFIDPALSDSIIKTIEGYDIPHSCIELELTESAFFDDKKLLLNTVDKLREAGLCISMDDFGTGYSSLNSLKDLPLDVIKLDGEFFNYSKDAQRSETIIKDTVSMAKNLHMKIVAEGIETKEQVEFLKEIGCDLIQGYYFARPMPLDDFEELMKYK